MKQASESAQRGGAATRSPWSLGLVGASAMGMYWYFFVATGWEPLELARFLAGVAGLWLPFGWLAFLLVREQFDDLLSQFTFSAIASYILTTLVYFGCCV